VLSKYKTDLNISHIPPIQIIIISENIVLQIVVENEIKLPSHDDFLLNLSPFMHH
jgi:hypothetical protein